jgi:esterase
MQLHHKIYGQGEPLIILHGLLGTLDNWQTIAKQLAQHFTVFTIDQRNHGLSEHHPLMDYAALAADLKEFMEAHWIFNAHILGHSMGGKVAMRFALDHPDMVNKLMVADIGIKTYNGGHEHIFAAMQAVPLNHIAKRQEAEDILLQHGIADFGTRQFLLKNLTRLKETGGFAWKANLQGIIDNYAHILSAVATPHADTYAGDALFIRGELSDYISDTDWQAIRTVFTHAQLATIPQAGHWVHADAPHLFLKKIDQFLGVVTG